MKIALSLSIIIILLHLSTIAQAQSKIELGVRFIAQATTFRYKMDIPGVTPLLDYLKPSPYYSRMRTAQGIGAIYYPTERIRLGADLLYSLQGGGYEERKTNLNYLTLPLWVGFNSRARRRLILTVQSGIQFSYLLSAKNVYKDGTKTDITRDVRRTTWGVPVAIGVKFKVQKKYFVTAQIYLYSDMTTISKTNSDFGVYNYVYPGVRLCIDQNLSIFKK